MKIKTGFCFPSTIVSLIPEPIWKQMAVYTHFHTSMIVKPSPGHRPQTPRSGMLVYIVSPLSKVEERHDGSITIDDKKRMYVRISQNVRRG